MCFFQIAHGTKTFLSKRQKNEKNGEAMVADDVVPPLLFSSRISWARGKRLNKGTP